MKKLFLTLLLLVGLATPVFAFAGQAGATDIFTGTCDGGTAKAAICDDVKAQQDNSRGDKANNPIVTIITVAIDVLSLVVGAAAIIGLLASSIKMVVSNGDSNAVSSARSGISYSLVGIVVVVLAQSLVAFVLNKL